MKKISVLLISGAITLAAGTASAQNHAPQHINCGTMQVMEEEFKQHPELREQYNQFQEQVEAYKRMQNAPFRSTQKRIIPVVFHVIHQCGQENISRAQIEDQLRILNEDFSLTNPSFDQTPSCHAAVAADCQIEFRLATKDDNGNCTDGIVRVASPKTFEANNQNGVKAVSRWSSHKYLNVWVVNSIGSVQSVGGEVLGYAQFPAGGLPSTDGVVIRHDCIGSIGTAQTGPFAPRFGRTMTHEVGHWLGLRHIWGDADCGSDGIDDTPIAAAPNYGVCWNDFPYNVGGCPGGTEGDTCGEMFMNYMDYSDDQCMSMFSNGQKEVMDATLATFRSYISSEDNLVATGTRDEDVANPVTCIPQSNFCDNRMMVCENATVTFNDASFNTESYSREWSFEGGTPATSTTANPTVTYSTAGVYDVSLTTSNSAGNNTLTKSNYIIVSPDAAQFPTGPFEETFGAPNNYENNFITQNPDNSDAKWEYVSLGGFGYGGAVRMRNYFNTATERDYLITPSYNLSSVANPVLMFRLAAAERGGEPNDIFRVYTSNNCGQSWGVPRRTINFNEMNSAGQFTNEFVPSVESHYKTYYVSLAAVAQQDNVRIRFEVESGTGDRANNIYLDDINIGSSLGAMNLEEQIGLSVYPNPTVNNTQVQFFASKSSTVSIRMFDMLGKEVLPVFNGKVGAGDQMFNVDMSNLSSGLYTIRLDLDGQSVYKKVVRQ